MAEKFSQKVEQINERLRAFGPEAVQEIKFTDRDGKLIGQVRYGYKPQYVFDAVNEILQPENWRYEIVSKEIFDFQAVVEVRLFVRIEGEWLCKGSQTGQMNIVKKNVGDAYKGAVTDAIQKCLSLLSIGSDAYRGLLKAVFSSDPQRSRTPPSSRQQPQHPPAQRNQTRGRPKKPPESQAQPAYQDPPPHGAADQLPHDLPQITGVNYQQRNGRIVATGDTFDKKELLKADGFRWDRSGKHWYKEVAVH